MKTVYCLRGLSGSGKDTYIKQQFACGYWNEDSSVICSADDFFMVDGNYQFDHTMIAEAHAYCMRKFLAAINNNVQTIIVNNTNICVHEISPYGLVAGAMGYKFNIIEMKSNIEHSIHRNAHGVPAYQIGVQAEAMRREVLPAWWPVTKA